MAAVGPEAEVQIVHRGVRFGGKSGRDVLIQSLSAHDRCCRKKSGFDSNVPFGAP